MQKGIQPPRHTKSFAPQRHSSVGRARGDSPRSTGSLGTVDTALAQWAAAERPAAPPSVGGFSMSSVDTALAQWAAAERAARQASGQSVTADSSALPGTRAQLEAEVLRLQRELAAARRGTHVSERVDKELRRVKRLWQESEHRLLLLQNELRTSQVTLRTLAADLTHAEALTAAQASRIDELVAAAEVNAALYRSRADELERTQLAITDKAAMVRQLQLQLVATAVSAEALSSEVHQLEVAAAEQLEETATLLTKMHASATERAQQHRAQLALWEQRASALIEAGPSIRLDLVLHQGNADMFAQFRSLIAEQRTNCEQEAALLRGWVVRSDGRGRKELQAQLAGLRQQLVDVQSARDQLRSSAHHEELASAMAKVDQAERAIHQLESLLSDERRLAAAREKAAAAAAAEHRAAVASAVAELKQAAAQMDAGLGRVVELEVEAVRRLQHQEAFRARTASLLLLQRHRPTLAKCYRAWRAETAKNVGAKLAKGSSSEAIQQLRHRSLSVALSGGVAGSVISEYMAATLSAVEDEWARREVNVEARHAALLDEVKASKTLAARAIKENEEQRGRLDIHAAVLASEAEEMRRNLQAAQERERAAAMELEQLRTRMAKTASGGHVDAVRLGVELDSAQREVAELRTMLAAADERHAAELAQGRAQVTKAEARRLELQAELAARARELADVRRSAGELQSVMVAAAQLEAGRQVEALEEACKALDERLQREVRARLEEAEAHRKSLDGLTSELNYVRRQLEEEYKPKLMETRIELEAARAELSGLREGLRFEAGRDARRPAEDGRHAAVAVGIVVSPSKTQSALPYIEGEEEARAEEPPRGGGKGPRPARGHRRRTSGRVRERASEALAVAGKDGRDGQARSRRAHSHHSELVVP
jgi:hypothetical protein